MISQVPAPRLNPYVMRLSPVYHIGTLNAARKRQGSLEGRGLSVSLCPEEWRSIARLGDAPTWTLSREDGSFLDAGAALADERVRAGVIAWARDSGYLRWGRRWELTAHDDDGNDLLLRFCTRREAVSERYALDPHSTDEDTPIVLRRLLLATPTMTHRAYQLQPPDASALDHALSFYVEDHLPEIDGLWWNEDLAPAAYSAPRGVIFTQHLSRWRTT